MSGNEFSGRKNVFLATCGRRRRSRGPFGVAGTRVVSRWSVLVLQRCQVFRFLMSGSNQTQQHDDTEMAMCRKLMFLTAGHYSVDVFWFFSRLQTRSSDLETLILFSSQFRFPRCVWSIYLPFVKLVYLLPSRGLVQETSNYSAACIQDAAVQIQN